MEQVQTIEQFRDFLTSLNYHKPTIINKRKLVKFNLLVVLDNFDLMGPEITLVFERRIKDLVKSEDTSIRFLIADGSTDTKKKFKYKLFKKD